jgi:hypothetical protein
MTDMLQPWTKVNVFLTLNIFITRTKRDECSATPH